MRDSMNTMASWSRASWSLSLRNIEGNFYLAMPMQGKVTEVFFSGIGQIPIFQKVCGEKESLYKITAPYEFLKDGHR